MKGIPVEKLVHAQMFPNARASDPENFQAFVDRNLIGEVHAESLAFYGPGNTLESKYPGLDYTNRTHRIRLSRFPWHRRLFRAFDALGLTPGEIGRLTTWKGTKWAKEKYEKETGVKIRDTTADGMATWDDNLGHAVGGVKGFTNSDDDNEPEEEEENDDNNNHDRGREVRDDDQDDEEASESELHSVGLELNARLRAGAARREAGDVNAVLDEEWEQWLKHIIESGFLHSNSGGTIQGLFASAGIPAALVPVDAMSAARAGRWSDVPEYLHVILRLTIEAEQRGQFEGAAGGTAPGRTGTRRTYSALRLPVGDSAPSQMATDTSGA